MNSKYTPKTSCSFCGTDSREAKKLVQSKKNPNIHICDECVKVAKVILTQDLPPEKQPA